MAARLIPALGCFDRWYLILPALSSVDQGLSRNIFDMSL